MTDRGIPSIQYAQSTQLEGLRRMQHARENPKPKKPLQAIDAGPKPAKVHFDIQIHNPPPVDPVAELLRRNPCAVRGHRPAYLTAGGIACYDCGARFT